MKSIRTGTEKDKDSYNRLEQDVKYQIRTAHKTYMKETVSNGLNDTHKKFWSIIKKY